MKCDFEHMFQIVWIYIDKIVRFWIAALEKTFFNLISKYDDSKLIIVRSRSRDFYTALDILARSLNSKHGRGGSKAYEISS